MNFLTARTIRSLLSNAARVVQHELAPTRVADEEITPARITYFSTGTRTKKRAA